MIADKLKVDLSVINSVIEDLSTLGLIQETNSGFEPTNTLIHLGKSSQSLQRCHINIRQKMIHDLLTRGSNLEGSNYSSFVTLSRKDARIIKELIIRHLEEVRDRIKPSKPEVMYLHCVDFVEI